MNTDCRVRQRNARKKRTDETARVWGVAVNRSKRTALFRQQKTAAVRRTR
jgi:hypothetical protein